MDAEIINKIQEPVMGLLGIGLSFMALYIIYKAIQLKNKEKLALIEKGMDPSLADSGPKRSKQRHLKNGLMLIGIAAGIFSGYILDITTNIPEFVSYPTMILIFSGLPLLYFHSLTKNEL